MQSALDLCVESLNKELLARGVCKPDVLFLMATGTQQLIDHIGELHETPLAELEHMPALWQASTLYSGTLGTLKLWALDDTSADVLPAQPGETPSSLPAWHTALPIWLAAEAGAVLCVHTSAGSALLPDARPGFALVHDHLNLSGASPLIGIGISQLGPLFPDQSRVHHLGLRHAALAKAETLGLQASEAVAACTLGPALETPAERRMLAKLGADVSVQALADPLIACSHAGLACLAIVALSVHQEEQTDLGLLVEQAAQASPRLNQWLLALVPDLQLAADAMRKAQLA